MNSWKEKIKEIQKIYQLRKDKPSNEEQTKMYLISPFLEMLGWDVRNPDDCIPEYIADVGVKKGEKVDYALLKNKRVALILEAKSLQTNLSSSIDQLYRYFLTLPECPIAILTNGKEYQFFTNIEGSHQMDTTPFYTIHLEQISDEDIVFLYDLQKQRFDEGNILQKIHQRKGVQQAKRFLLDQLSFPNDEVVIAFLDTIHFKGSKTKTIKEEYRQYLQEAMKELTIGNPLPKTLKKQKQSSTNEIKKKLEEKVNTKGYRIENVIPARCKGKKLLGIQFENGQTISCSIWKESLVLVLNKMIEENKFSLIQKNKSLYDKLCPYQRKKKPLELRESKELKNNILIETNLSASDIVIRLQEIASTCAISFQLQIKDYES